MTLARIGTQTDPYKIDPPRRAADASGLQIQILTDLQAAEKPWRALQAEALMAPHQSFEWIAALIAAGHCRHDLRIVMAFDPEYGCVFLAPLVLRAHAGLRILEWLCNGQGNYASALFHSRFWCSPDAPVFADFWTTVLAALPHIDAVHLGNLPQNLDENDNPMRELPHVVATEPGRSFPLTPDWREHYDNRFSASSRRELRRCERRLADRGTLEFISACDRQTRSRVFAALTAQKRAQFARDGIGDFLSDAAIETFYANLLAAPDSADGPKLELFALACGGEIVSANMGLRFQNRFYGLISSTTSGPERRHAPGNILFLRIVEHLAEAGLERFDCGAGSDAHKLRWCTDCDERFHVAAGLTPRGRVFIGALKAQLKLKGLIKGSATLWPIAKKLRRMKGNATRLFAPLLPARA